MSLISEVPGVVIKIGIGLFVLFLLIVVFRGVKTQGYVFQAFEVPKNYEERGLSGLVLSTMLADKVRVIKGNSPKSRVDSLEIDIDDKPDLNVDVMGVGLSTGNLSYHVREMLGIETKFITGDLIDLDQQLSLTVRMNDGTKKTFTEPYEEGAVMTAIEKAVENAAIMIIEKVDPYRLAVYYFYQDDFEKAQEVIREIIRDIPEDRKWAYHLWAFIKKEEGDIERSREFFELALKEDPKFRDALHIYGWLHFQEGDFAQAQQLFKGAYDQDPSNFGINQGMALSSWRLGETEEAESYYQNNTKNHPDNIWSYMNYASFINYSSRDSAHSAQIWLDASKALTESSDHFMALAEYYKLTGHQDSVTICAMTALEYNPDNEPALMQVANYAFNIEEDFDKSASYFKRLVSVLKRRNFDDGMQQNALNQLAMSEYKTGKLDSARLHIEEAIELNPKNRWPWTTLAEICALEGKHDEFFDHLETAVSLGFDLAIYQDDEIYRDYKSYRRFQDLLTPKEELLN